MADGPKIPVEELNLMDRIPDGPLTNDTSPRSKENADPCGHTMGGRNLVVSIDGTGNQFGMKNTNVIELYNLILKDDEHDQLTWYNSGIGTYARPSWKSLKFYRQVIYHKVDLAIAWNFQATVLAAYRWLSENYKSGDCIFLFGFSRGAYQVRVLSAMIDKVGLIYKGNETQISFAYELYCDPESDKSSHSVTQVGSPAMRQKFSLAERFRRFFSGNDEEIHTEEKTTMAERFKNAFSRRDVRVHFVGAWDTVSSIGIARGTHMLPRTVDGMKHVCFFRHALALDERRVKFLPEYAYGGSAQPPAETQCEAPHNPPPKNKEEPPADDMPSNHISATKNGDAVGGSKVGKEPLEEDPHTLEVWFAGTHSDIGGGNAENARMDRSRPPLRWMVFEAGAHGLRTARFDRVLLPNEQVEIKESLTWAWWPLELLCLPHLTYAGPKEGKRMTYKPHVGSGRKLHAGQKIHGSFTLTDKTKKEYTPQARPLDDDPLFWEKVRDDKNRLGAWRAVDLYEYTQILVNKSTSTKDGASAIWQTLRQTASSGDGRQAVYEAVIMVLKDSLLELETKHQLLTNAMDILTATARTDTLLKLEHSANVRPSVSDLWKSAKIDHQMIAHQFMEQFTDLGPLVLNGHTYSVVSVAFSSDGGRVVSGSGDRTVRIWDTETGKQVGEPFQGHTESILSVAFSPDGRRIVSGSGDTTARIWDTETGKQVGEPFQGHTRWVRSVAFSPDGKRVVSGSDDKTVRMWEAETRLQIGEPLHGHTDRIFSVAFSPDGRRVVSGSEDKTVRTWDAETGKQVGEPFQGHTGTVMSAAFSPDGRRVVSGSGDKTARIWDAETGMQVGEPLQGHRDWVNSVTFSPDGRRVVLVSGSDDETVRIWDAETGTQVGDPFQGHEGSVNSATFSPDGLRVVSGSGDRTVRIWDTETWEVSQPVATGQYN
ncbi:hypothetical protein GALMADRAFT_144010 [Galerina marginata CBS 339.88]|uniref:T6SS Phospholipase effector Tle1-like catalytic domain-containing protein n=1 Tax=Galerina marginata (strain CBS 339.88) TaxID=685588 RepID=A0A067SUD3_GALM3|nr:hypothetical protein GALMADRAFT_144010 [Galerina marginata CBS 339.88]